MKLKISEIKNQFWGNYRKIVKLDTVISLLSRNAPLDFILTELDRVKMELKRKDHEINFIMIDKKDKPKEIEGKLIFDNIRYVLDGMFDIQTFKLFYEQYSISDIYNEFYKNNECTSFVEDKSNKTNFEEFIDKQIEGLNGIRNDLKSNDVYLLKTDLDSLIDDIQLTNNDIFFIYNYGGIDGDKSDDFEFLQNMSEFEQCGACDLAFDIWVKDKDNFLKNLKNANSKNQVSEGQNKEVTQKSETSYLNIIQALKDELLNRGLFENQSSLISYLSNSYTGYTGLSETNLREKFSKANKIKLN